MNEPHAVYRGPRRWGQGLVTLAAALLLAGAAVAEEKPVEKPVEGASEAEGKSLPRISPHALAAQRRAREDDQASPARSGLQSLMHRQALRHHLTPARLGA